jgi:hypothetical protein
VRNAWGVVIISKQKEIKIILSAQKARLRRGKILKLSFFLAALGQDIGHTGFTNAFEIKSHSKLAVKYIDDSPLEYYHCALFFKIILKTKFFNRKKNKKENILHFLTFKEYQILREFVLYLILRTDPKYHSHFIDTFEYHIKEVDRTKPVKSTSFDLKKLEEQIEKNKDKTVRFIFFKNKI